MSHLKLYAVVAAAAVAVVVVEASSSGGGNSGSSMKGSSNSSTNSSSMKGSSNSSTNSSSNSIKLSLLHFRTIQLHLVHTRPCNFSVFPSAVTLNGDNLQTQL